MATTRSPSEAEVFQLVARGESDAEIAGALLVSLQTVKAHVARVPAYEHGLVRRGE